MEICPKCHSLVSFNSHFGAYICKKCNWVDNSFFKWRLDTYSSTAHFSKYKTEPKIKNNLSKNAV